MKASELRIGNLIECFVCKNSINLTEGWNVSRIDAVKPNEVHIRIDGKYDYDFLMSGLEEQNARGIILTEERLVKFGFHNDEMLEGEKCYSIPGFNFYVAIGEEFKLKVCGNFDTICIAKFKYIHQLQNIFFFLTGKEIATN